MKSVRFDCSQNKIGYTHSPTEYDRSHFAIPPSPNRIFDLSLIASSSSPISPSSPASPCSPSSPSSSSLAFPTSSPTKALCNRRPYIAPLDFSSIPNQCSKQSSNDHIQQKGNKPPKLMINTEITSGPLFFTHLSTQYHSRLEEEHDDGNNPMMMMMADRLKNLNPSSLEIY